MTTREFADAMGISVNAAWRALNAALTGGTYKGLALAVKVTNGVGRGGTQLLVSRKSLAALTSENSDLTSERSSAYHSVLTPWKEDLVLRVDAASKVKGTKLKDAIAAVMEGATWPDGPKQGQALSAATLRDWYYKYEEAGGTRAFARKERSDRGATRIILSEKIDPALTGIGKTIEEQVAFRDETHRDIADLWRKMGSWVDVQNATIGILSVKLRAIGIRCSDAEMLELARLPKRTIQRFQFAQLLGKRKNDAAAFAATQTPRIRRNRIYKDGSPILPGEWVTMDVHPVDVRVRREDGSVATPRMIDFKCLATNRHYYNLVLLEPGKGIRQDHISAAFAALCSDPRWGVPKRIYTDRGSEYAHLFSDFVEALLRLRQRVDHFDIQKLDEHAKTRSGVYRSNPYNPQSKNIEGDFAMIERLLQMMPGWIGGNRMKKKTQNQGREPVPYPGPFEGFKADFARIIEYLHNKPQSGALGGKSPNERYNELVAQHKWSAVPIESKELAFAFSKRRLCTIDRSTFKLKRPGQPPGQSTLWWCKRTHTLPQGTKVWVRLSPFPDDPKAYVFANDSAEKFIGVAEPETYFAMDDPEGAKEQRRRAKDMREDFDSIEQLLPDHNPIDAVSEFVARKPPLVLPEPRAGISAGSHLKRAALAHKSNPERDRKRLVAIREEEDAAEAALINQLRYRSAAEN